MILEMIAINTQKPQRSPTVYIHHPAQTTASHASPHPHLSGHRRHTELVDRSYSNSHVSPLQIDSSFITSTLPDEPRQLHSGVPPQHSPIHIQMHISASYTQTHALCPPLGIMPHTGTPLISKLFSPPQTLHVVYSNRPKDI